MTAFRDARQGELPAVIRGRICVIGAGAAGITLARTLARTTPGVILVESGGFDIDGRTQSLYAGRQLGLPYFDLTSCRLRFFGGTTNHWTGYCRANDMIDYEARPEIGLPGWPIGHDDLAPFIPDAGRSLGIEPDAQDPAGVVRAAGADPAWLVDDEQRSSGGPLQTKIFQLAPDIRLGKIFRDEIAGLANLEPWLNLNATALRLDPVTVRVTHLEAATITGAKTRIEADHFVLCCHAIENARLLLASNDIRPAGLGNEHDHVGRYFADHATIYASRFIPSESFPALYDRGYAAAHDLNANLSFTDDYLRKSGLLQYYCRFNPYLLSDETKEAKEGVRQGFWEPGSLEFLADVAGMMTEIDGVVKQELVQRGRAVLPDYYLLDHRIEQRPNRDSRVLLSGRTDALGSRIADLDWRISDEDVDTFRRGQETIAREMAALGHGRIEAEEITRELVEARVEGHYHHVGTTRMSAAAADGVVDANCTVHGIANLHVGGSSTFPSGGYSGPTMMIIAMALRQAQHLQKVIAA